MFGLTALSEAGGVLDWMAQNWIILFGVVLFIIIILVALKVA